MHLIKRLLHRAATTPIVWPILNNSLVRVANVLQQARREFEDHETRHRLEKDALTISPDLTVLRGPVIGLKDPRALSYGSALIPKLLGCYEMELHPLFEVICTQRYETIHNIGCAEGYYAAGLALRMPGARIIAYDTDKGARRACQEMAELNGLADRVKVRGGITQDDLLKMTDGCLVLCDCEGFEATLLNKAVARHHQQSAFLIEIHDNVDPGISEIITGAFEETHVITRTTSIDDLKKTFLYDFPELQGFLLQERRWLVSEHRPTLMDWFWCVPQPAKA